MFVISGVDNSTYRKPHGLAQSFHQVRMDSLKWDRYLDTEVGFEFSNIKPLANIHTPLLDTIVYFLSSKMNFNGGVSTPGTIPLHTPLVT